MTSVSSPGTGLAGLDAVLRGLREGDNVVWQIESVEDDYAPVVAPFVRAARAAGRRVVYHRFARHPALVAQGAGVELDALDPSMGFESFTAAIHASVERAGAGACHVFDCLSELAGDWCSDLMLGNFFRVTCPYLFQLDTIAYFAVLRDGHSLEAVHAIRSTTQLLVDVFRQGLTRYVHPLKVEGRHSPTMYLPHAWEGDLFRPLTESAVLAEALADASAGRLDPAARLDVWDRRFIEAREIQEAVRAGARPWSDERDAFRALVRMMLTRDDRLVELAERYLELNDLLAIRRRMIGTGLVGGKAAGMLVARAVLEVTEPAWRHRFEPHDSWYIGSDVFYTYLVQNGAWHARRGQRSRDSFLEGAAQARERLQAGAFPPFVLHQCVAMLDYYGQSPIIVRSSSLLEDGFGNAFTGKYESVFCPNQGAPEERLEALLAAVRTVYASAMSEAALRYRDDRGLLDRDEQMAILVQRVSGAVHGRFFYPQAAGVALSYNPYVWNHAIDPDAGVARLVFGMGTRAVDRSDDDYTRIIALNAPQLRPEHSLDEVTEYAQRRVDVLDLEANRFTSAPIDEVVAESPNLPIDLFATRRRGAGGGWVLTFEKLLWATPLVDELRQLLATLREGYRYPVDVEFTANFLAGGDFRLNLVQCRPLQVKEGGIVPPPPDGLPDEDLLAASRGPVVGQSTSARVDRVIFVDPDAYATLSTQDRHEVARVIGRATRADEAGRRVLLLGPGRWGTTTPSLGVPVSFAEIRRVAALGEVMRLGDVIPDVSLGSHFFNDLVESGMLYVAFYPTHPGHRLDEARLRAAPNQLSRLLPDDARLAQVVRVVDFPLPGDGRALWLHADCVRQEVMCYLRAARE
ncbi:PEP/pyruvate-binding domain-containing protein [Anaeromyxobacter sp. Fw109-5]|uniref:PEP/pyruvate-binding domain-containing protein n=1 Tax=Anaeromyxobacter sp. (strain Fw109-5) TaxID=404589 RepID=UPI0000ED80D8|nr:PEP/pyruvate-binding domain-containing protein [Anaeromyxobacter sp. Fw109-5]ABS27103.1 pyruvate phosphate dikinase PEP/pyruvate-binding [Anaeromyxobacter sp. Fw109-5]